MAITLRLTDEHKRKILFLEETLKMKTNTAVLLFCLNKQFEIEKKKAELKELESLSDKK